MSAAIHKLTLPLSPGLCRVQTHRGAMPLSVAWQGEAPRVWVAADPKQPAVERQFLLVWTGGEAPRGSTFLGTVLSPDHGYVLHVYDTREEEPRG